METGKKKYSRGVYFIKATNSNGNNKDFYLKSTIGNSEVFSKVVRVEKDNGFHKRTIHFDYWLYFRDSTNWKRCTKTGLVFTGKKYVFEGNIPEIVNFHCKTEKGKEWENPKHLLLVQFSNDGQSIAIDYFNNFYPHRRHLIELLVKEHNFLIDEPITSEV